MTHPTCATCQFFRSTECHRNSPRHNLPQWPLVKTVDWCGQHKPEGDEVSYDKLLRVAEVIAGGLCANPANMDTMSDFKLAMWTVSAAQKLIAACKKSADGTSAEP